MRSLSRDGFPQEATEAEQESWLGARGGAGARPSPHRRLRVFSGRSREAADTDGAMAPSEGRRARQRVLGVSCPRPRPGRPLCLSTAQAGREAHVGSRPSRCSRRAARRWGPAAPGPGT